MAHTRIGPVAVAAICLAFIAVGSAIKTGYIEIRRGSRADTSGVVVRTGAGDVEMPVARGDSAANSPAPPTPTDPPIGSHLLFTPHRRADSFTFTGTGSESLDHDV